MHITVCGVGAALGLVAQLLCPKSLKSGAVSDFDIHNNRYATYYGCGYATKKLGA
jgi:hypothetical protein